MTREGIPQTKLELPRTHPKIKVCIKSEGPASHLFQPSRSIFTIQVKCSKTEHLLCILVVVVGTSLEQMRHTPPPNIKNDWSVGGDREGETLKKDPPPQAGASWPSEWNSKLPIVRQVCSSSGSLQRFRWAARAPCLLKCPFRHFLSLLSCQPLGQELLYHVESLGQQRVNLLPLRRSPYK